MKKLTICFCMFIFISSIGFCLSPAEQADQYLSSASNCLKNDDFKGACDWFEKILELNVTVPDVFYFHYGRALIKQGENEKGKTNIKEYLKLANPNDKLYEIAKSLLSQEKNRKSASEALNKRLDREDREREAIANGNSGIPHSDQHTGKTFKAIGKEWRVGQYDISWSETQNWISNLGGGWRTPTRAELKSLYDAVGRTSAIGKDLVWAEKTDSSSAWGITFHSGHEYSDSIGVRYYFLRAVAVR